MSRFEVYSQSEYCLCEIEKIEGEVFVHIHFHQWNPSTLKFLKTELEKFKHTLKTLGYDSFYSYTTNKKFCKLLGEHEVLGEVEHEGKYLEVVRWPL